MVVLRTLEHIDRGRFEPTVLVVDTDDPSRASPPEFIRRTAALGVPIMRYPVSKMPGLGRALEQLRLGQLIRRSRPDVVHVHTARVAGGRKTVLAAWIARVPVILRTEHNSPTAFGGPDFDSMAQRIADRVTDRFVTVSEHDRAEQISVVGRRPERVVAIHNGIDTAYFSPDVVSPAESQDDGRLTIGTVGRLSQQKGHADLLRAHALLATRGHATRLVIVGTGPCDEGLRRLADELGTAGDVILAGNRSDPRPWMMGMDVAAMPSLHEGLSLTLLELMAMERPTVISDHPGLVEAAIPGETSLVVPRRDPVALADAIERLLRDPDLRRSLGRAGRRHVCAHFTFDRYLAATTHLYESLLGAGHDG
jgi:glycosyltransferase involved in cell wall biosynthesis